MKVTGTLGTILPLIIGAAAMLLATTSAVSSWWLVRSSDGKCLVVDIEPTHKDKGVTKIGKDVYQSADEAEADAKRLCKEAAASDQSTSHAK
jgi:hypothetical protein